MFMRISYGSCSDCESRQTFVTGFKANVEESELLRFAKDAYLFEQLGIG